MARDFLVRIVVDDRSVEEHNRPWHWTNVSLGGNFYVRADDYAQAFELGAEQYRDECLKRAEATTAIEVG